MATTKRYTTEDLYDLPDDGYRYGLIRGELLRMAPTGERHSDTAGNIFVFLHRLGRSTGIGKATFGDAAFVLAAAPDSTLAPDVGFVRFDRLDPSRDTSKFFPIPPDIAVEVMSPSNRPGETGAKVRAYRDAGVPLVMVVYPRNRTVRVYRDDEEELLTAADAVDLRPIFPGVLLPLSAIFE